MPDALQRQRLLSMGAGGVLGLLGLLIAGLAGQPMVASAAVVGLVVWTVGHVLLLAATDPGEVPPAEPTRRELVDALDKLDADDEVRRLERLAHRRLHRE